MVPYLPEMCNVLRLEMESEIPREPGPPGTPVYDVDCNEGPVVETHYLLDE